MRIVVIGSVALNHYIKVRKPKDLDVVIHLDDLDQFMKDFRLKTLSPKNSRKFHGVDWDGRHYEIEVAGVQADSSAALLYEIADSFDKDENGYLIPPMGLLYQIKMCHRFKFGPSFEKTRRDILLLRGFVPGECDPMGEDFALRPISKTPDPLWIDFLKKRKEESEKKTPKLKGVSKGSFFVDRYGDVPQIVHDTIHLTQALDGPPAYTNFQVGEVECCMKKFFSVDEQIRLNAVFEESATLAIERSIWPTQFKSDEYKAFKMSLQKLCCHISSGRFRTFAWVNYDKVLAMYEKGAIVEKFRKGLDNGTVQFQEVNKKEGVTK